MKEEKWLWYIAKLIVILRSLFLEPISPPLKCELALCLDLANSHVVKLLLYHYKSKSQKVLLLLLAF